MHNNRYEFPEIMADQDLVGIVELQADIADVNSVFLDARILGACRIYGKCADILDPQKAAAVRQTIDRVFAAEAEKRTASNRLHIADGVAMDSIINIAIDNRSVFSKVPAFVKVDYFEAAGLLNLVFEKGMAEVPEIPAMSEDEHANYQAEMYSRSF